MLLYAFLIFFIGLAAALAWFLVAHDHGEKEPIGMLWMAAGLGLVGALAAGLIESLVLPAKDLMPGASIGALFAATLGVGVIEEACKFLPLAFLLYRKRYFNEHTDGVIYFALVGLGFGLPENILYTVQFGTATGLTRVLLTPFFHAATTAMVGFYLARRKLTHRSPYMVAVPLAVAMVLHGLYDFGLSTGDALSATMSVLITLTVSGGLFYFYTRAHQYDQDAGLSVVGSNSFCRTCGFANPKHKLYCVNCGKNA